MRWDWDNHILMPECGITKNLFHRLLNYISVFDSMWADRIRPASPLDIKMFIQIIEQSSYPGKKESSICPMPLDLQRLNLRSIAIVLFLLIQMMHITDFYQQATTFSNLLHK